MGVAVILLSLASVSIGYWLGGFWILVFPSLVAIGACCAALMEWVFPKVSLRRHARAQRAFQSTAPMPEANVAEKATSFRTKEAERSNREPEQSSQIPKRRSELPREYRVERPYERHPETVAPMPRAITPVQQKPTPSQPVTAIVKTATAVTFAAPVVSGTPFIPPDSQSAKSPNLDVVLRKRVPKKVFSPEHYRRHERTPGFLYVARNDHHRVGLYKMGYTTLASPADRIASLNAQHKSASDVGAFEHVFAVPTAASYLTEQALFDFLSEFRVAEKREFFYGPLSHFIEAMQAAAKISFGDASELNAMYERGHVDMEGVLSFPTDLRTAHIPDRPDGGGWIYVCRNKWHPEDIYRLGFTTVSPYRKCDTINAIQKELTCQIGFYAVVACVAVGSVPHFKRRLSKRTKPYQIAGTQSFYHLPLSRLMDEARSANPATVANTAILQTGSRYETTDKSLCGPVLPLVAASQNYHTNVTPVQCIRQITVAVKPAQAETIHLSVLNDAQPNSVKFHGRDSIITVEAVIRIVGDWAPWACHCPACRQMLRFKGQIGDEGLVQCPCCTGSLFTKIGPRGVDVRLSMGVT